MIIGTPTPKPPVQKYEAAQAGRTHAVQLVTRYTDGTKFCFTVRSEPTQHAARAQAARMNQEAGL